MAQFTTGEAVAVWLPIARVPTRTVAFLVDVVVMALLLPFLLYATAILIETVRPDEAWDEAAFLVVSVSVLVGYPVLCETLSNGSSLGKLALGLRVVRLDGGPIDYRHALIRGLVGAIVDFWMLGGLGMVAVVTSVCSPAGRRIGDVLAGTVVVHSEARLPAPKPVVPPVRLQAWSESLDVAALSSESVLALRKYLTRVNSLTPQAREELGTRLVGTVCARLGVTPPPGYPPVEIVGSVLAQRQRQALPRARTFAA